VPTLPTRTGRDDPLHYPRAPWPQARRGRTEEDATTHLTHSTTTHPTTNQRPPESCHSIQAGRRQRARRRARALLGRLPLVLALSAALLVVVASPAFAAGTATPTLSGVIDNLRNWIVGILAGVAILFLTIGGLRYLTAGGDPGQVEKAKIALKSAAVGYALAILAPLLVSCATSSLQLPYSGWMAFHSLQGHHLVSPLQGVH